jgi:type IV secretory pathway TraG/TraD family ATPase VirD4
MFINGASGSGKTVAMLNFVVEACEKNLPLIYLDGKGATDLYDEIATISAKHNRTFKVFSLSGCVPAVGYDIISSGSFTELKNRIMQLFIVANDAGSDYYQNNLEMFVNNVCLLIEYNGLRIDLARFVNLVSDMDALLGLSQNKINNNGSEIWLYPYFSEIKELRADQSPRTSLLTKLSPFINSSYGHLFNVIDKDNVINLYQSIKNNEIILFLLDASSYASDTKKIAQMVISDINATFSKLGSEKNPIKTFCCFDEFKSYETDAIASTIALHRSNGMHAIIGTQSLAIIDREIGNAILTNCQTHFVMASADADAERFATEFGTRKKVETSTRIQAEQEQITDITSRVIEDFKISKQDIKDIRVKLGQGFLHRKAKGKPPVKIQVIKQI